ncbi:uncharacterized protein BJ212DRAFT_1263798 [Suillus subaureus]|uniref:Uncharacterized protein n=1 Tax=Suillus subaureus TaxID=48587 RepID=A0A9P7JHK2_9AGAM|nr:uncharacterized protein BJ212DRAFT_1263798 [Suillus subaureus]KAG1822630.1 hypothetical protein BJ212DRAFT_1263798 [Suillus subaureus]
MSNTQTSQRHTLSGNSNLRNTDYTDPAAQVNQGIIDGRPEGQQPRAAPVTLDTYVDEDASANTPLVTRASDTLVGATSADVHDGLGHPGQGMSSKELRHDGQPGRKRHGQGTISSVRGWQGMVSRSWMVRVSVDLLPQSLTLGESNRHQSLTAQTMTCCEYEI